MLDLIKYDTIINLIDIKVAAKGFYGGARQVTEQQGLKVDCMKQDSSGSKSFKSKLVHQWMITQYR